MAHFDKIIGIDGIVANGDDLKLLRMACVEIASKSRHCLTLDVHLLHFASTPSSLLASSGSRLDEPPLSFYAGTNAEACHMIERVKQMKAKIIESNSFNMDIKTAYTIVYESLRSVNKTQQTKKIKRLCGRLLWRSMSNYTLSVLVNPNKLASSVIYLAHHYLECCKSKQFKISRKHWPTEFETNTGFKVNDLESTVYLLYTLDNHHQLM